ncbi:CPBP family intramembrane glutamic endopeptidase [Enterococcus sp. DIV0800]|uniref:CPBP family intramembrane glutamic endopeptidase n=1 Tax=unclassified Enterococcus TaxID=2608891 RepID=UPI003D2FC899
MEHTRQKNTGKVKDIKKTGWMVLFYTIVFSGIVSIGGTLMGMIVTQRYQGILSQEDISNKLASSGMHYIVALCAGLLVISLFRGKEGLTDFTHVNQKIDFKIFFMLFSGFVGIQFLTTYVDTGLETIFNQFGLTLKSQFSAASAGSTTFSMFLYTSFAAPIAEELVFRGAILRSLEKYGKSFAIVASSALFGIYHGNFSQGIFAFFVGLILGYTTIKFSLKWAIALHMFNNFILGDLLSHLTFGLPIHIQSLISYIIILPFFVLGIFFLIKNRKAIYHFFFSTSVSLGATKTFLTSIGIISFTGINLYYAINSVHQLIS